MYSYSEEQLHELRQALEQSVKVIEQWHGKEVFDIYYKHAPEMKLIREALAAPSPHPSGQGMEGWKEKLENELFSLQTESGKPRLTTGEIDMLSESILENIITPLQQSPVKECYVEVSQSEWLNLKVKEREQIGGGEIYLKKVTLPIGKPVECYDIDSAKKLRGYFGKNDASIFEQWAYDYFDKIIKKLEQLPIGKEIDVEGLRERFDTFWGYKDKVTKQEIFNWFKQNIPLITNKKIKNNDTGK